MWFKIGLIRGVVWGDFSGTENNNLLNNIVFKKLILIKYYEIYKEPGQQRGN